MAKVLGSVGRATKAATFYNRAVTILELSKGRESEDLVMPLSGLGNLLLKQGKAKEAEVHFVRLKFIFFSCRMFIFLFFFFFLLSLLSL